MPARCKATLISGKRAGERCRCAAVCASDHRGKPRCCRRHSVAQECSICLAFDNRVVTCVDLPCDHCFHAKCIGRWLADHDSCPMCRRSSQPTLQPPQVETVLELELDWKHVACHGACWLLSRPDCMMAAIMVLAWMWSKFAT